MRIVSAAYIPHVIAHYALRRSARQRRFEDAMRISLGVNLLNVVGNFLLIYETRTLPLFGGIRIWGAGMGVRGAALSTAISMGLSGLAMLVSVLPSRQDALKLTRRDSYSLRGGEDAFCAWGCRRYGTHDHSDRPDPLCLHRLLAGHHSAVRAPFGRDRRRRVLQSRFGLSSAAMTSVGQSMGAKLLPRAQAGGPNLPRPVPGRDAPGQRE